MALSHWHLSCLEEPNLGFNLFLDNLTDIKPFRMNGSEEFICLTITDDKLTLGISD